MYIKRYTIIKEMMKCIDFSRDRIHLSQKCDIEEDKDEVGRAWKKSTKKEGSPKEESR